MKVSVLPSGRAARPRSPHVIFPVVALAIFLAPSVHAESPPDGDGGLRADSLRLDNASVWIGSGSLAAGTTVSASGNASLAMGWGSLALGDYSAALGVGSVADGTGLVAVGGAHASGDHSLAAGWGTTYGAGSFALGGHAYGWNSVATGLGSLAVGADTVAVGRYNHPGHPVGIDPAAWATGLDPEAIHPSGQIFVVGNGTDAGRSNALVVYNSGNVEVGGVLEADGGAKVAGADVLTVGNLSVHGGLLRHDAVLNWGIDSMAGEHSIAIGKNARAAGRSSLAVGNGSSVHSESGMSMHGAYVSGIGAIGIGKPAWATNRNSLAIGVGAISLGASSVAVSGGDQSSSYGNIACADYSLAIGGYQNRSMGRGTFSSGHGCYAEAAYEVVMGARNLSAESYSYEGSPDTWVETDSLFQLGNGNPELAGEYSNAITTLKNGQTTLTNKQWDVLNPTAVPAEAAASSDGTRWSWRDTPS